MTFCKPWVGCCLILSMFILSSCSSESRDKLPSLFEVLDDSHTGLHFTNTLTPNDSFNVFHYMYFYNGAGIGAGDFNNDGLIDLFFCIQPGNEQIIS